MSILDNRSQELSKHILTPELDIFFVSYTKNKKSKNFTIHRLVALAFVDNPENKNIVNHIDGNKTNNTPDNLEWCTCEYNHHHAAINGLSASGERVSSSKLNDRCILAIKKLSTLGFSHGKIAEIFDVSRSNITQILLGKTWRGHTLTGQELTPTK